MKGGKGKMRCRRLRGAGVRSRIGRAGAAASLLLGLLGVSPSLAEAPPRRQSVLIFYANETSQATARSENYANVLAVLRRTGGPQAEQTAASVLRDTERFPELVKRDLAELGSAAQRWKFDLVFVTTETAFE